MLDQRKACVFGRVPMFYYLLHIPLIHALALAVWYARAGARMRTDAARSRATGGTLTTLIC